MPKLMNIYVTQMTPKQKKELLGIYQDYLYFVKGLELTLQKNNLDELSYKFIERHDWESGFSQELPWQISYVTYNEKDEYTKFVKGADNTPSKYTYMSLSHTNEKNDVDLPQVNCHSENYQVTTIDMNLPCLVERYSMAYVPGQKMKDADLLIDGKFHAKYTGSKFQDMSVDDALNDPDMNAEFRVLLNIADYFDHNHEDLVRCDKKELYAKLGRVLRRITAAETLSGFENVILDLIGVYSDKTQEIVRGFFPTKSGDALWETAENEHLISSAEMMKHYMNIRHLMRHQWDSLDGVGKFTPRTNIKNDEVRNAYKKSYALFFDKSMPERVKEYQKTSIQMQTLLKLIYPNLLTRENGETNSKFIVRLKEWQNENPDKTALVCTNYPIASEKHKSLVGNIAKVAPQTKVLDNLEEKDLPTFEKMEEMYYVRSWYLSEYSHVEADMMNYCFGRGLEYGRNETWDYFKKNVLSKQKYDIWCQYRKLRNNLSHNYLNTELQTELHNTVKGSFGKDIFELGDFVRQNYPTFTKQDDGFYKGVHNDGLEVRIDMDNMKILSRKDKDGNNLPLFDKNSENKSEKTQQPDTEIKIHWWENQIVDCRLPNGIYIDLKRQKVCFPDDTRICFDRTEGNFFRLGDNKLYTDKTFMITKFYEQGKYRELERNEDRMVTKGHRMRTDSRGRIKEDNISLAGGKKLCIKFNYGYSGSIITFPDGTELNVSLGKFEVSHNGVVLNYANRHNFKNSYKPQSDILSAKKSGNGR